MGYYTDYLLTVEIVDHDVYSPPQDNLETIYSGTAVGSITHYVSLIHDHVRPGGGYKVFNDDGSSYDSCKWYDHELHMRGFSAKHPGVLFKLMGVGEEGGDYWMKYFIEGRMQRAKTMLQHEPFDREKLS